MEKIPDLEREVPVASISSKPDSKLSKDKPKGPQKKQRGTKGKVKASWNRPYPKGYRIPKWDPSAMARTLIELTAKEQERMNRTFP
ncbi:hypothetical protein O181_021542 [Austropuccinia psidii MF-1]|uniref:Uncharacterized protein n=1 Tax=Austropuccinia psidii MF-1 TaxID=1389203 RepID=A0A9Q3GWC5_9BASI|nr:hypothetical protein [Austropuccinia psidii MF-1]